MKIQSLLSTLGLVMGMSLIGCGSDSTAVRVLHGSPDAPAVDVLVNDSVALENVSYLESSDYLEVDPGSTNLKVNAAGTETSVINADVTLEADRNYTVIATNSLADIEPLVLTDDPTDPEAGNIKVRVVHGAPSAPEVDVYATAPGTDLDDAEPVLEDVPFKAVSDYLEVPAGEYELTVTIANSTDVAIGPATVDLEDGDIRTVVAVESEGGGAPFDFKIFNDKK